jgi:hypothetical protein
MRLMIKFLSLILIIVLTTVILTNCHSTRESSKRNVLIKDSGENFDKFYDKFHKDSLFQMSRVKFPLGGMSLDGFTITQWTKDNLPLMKSKIYDVDTTEYKVTFNKTEKTFTEKVWIQNSGFSWECRFELIDKRWYLVYVLASNL